MIDPFVSGDDPFALFAKWYAAAAASESGDPDAAALATVAPDGMPAVRMVLIREFGADGFVFYTNYDSRKGDHLAAHPQAAFCLHWKSLRRQIRVEGDIGRVAAAQSDAYFASRPRESRIGAWASLQSRPLPGRAGLEERVAEYSAEFADAVPRPPHWGGYRLKPRMIEFWQQGEHRLHDRQVYTRQANGGWSIMRLYP